MVNFPRSEEKYQKYHNYQIFNFELSFKWKVPKLLTTVLVVLVGFQAFRTPISATNLYHGNVRSQQERNFILFSVKLKGLQFSKKKNWFAMERRKLFEREERFVSNKCRRSSTQSLLFNSVRKDF